MTTRRTDWCANMCTRIGRRYMLPLVVTAMQLMACEPRERIWLAPGSKRDSLVFLFGPEMHGRPGGIVNHLEIADCLQDPPQPGRRWYWYIVNISGDNMPPSVRYGVTPPGYHLRQIPEPLAPGCYDAWGGLGGRLRFEILTDGSVREIPGYK